MIPPPETPSRRVALTSVSLIHGYNSTGSKKDQNSTPPKIKHKIKNSTIESLCVHSTVEGGVIGCIESSLYSTITQQRCIVFVFLASKSQTLAVDQRRSCFHHSHPLLSMPRSSEYPPVPFFPDRIFFLHAAVADNSGFTGRGGATERERERLTGVASPASIPIYLRVNPPPPPSPKKEKKIHEHVSRRNPALICSFQARRRTASGRDYPRWRRQRWCFLLPPGSCVGGNNNNNH